MKKLIYLILMVLGIYSTAAYSRVIFNESNSAVDNLNQLRKHNSIVEFDYAMCLTQKQKETLEQSGLIVDCVFPYVTKYKAEFFPEYREIGWNESFGDAQTNVYSELKSRNSSTENNLKNSKERLSLTKKDLEEIYVATVLDYNKKFKDNSAELADKSVAWLHESREGVSFISGPSLDTVIKDKNTGEGVGIDTVRSTGFNFKEIDYVLSNSSQHEKFWYVADSRVTFKYPIEAYSVDFTSSYEDDEFGETYENLYFINGITETVNKNIFGTYTCKYELTDYIFDEAPLHNLHVEIPTLSFASNKISIYRSYEEQINLLKPGVTITRILRDLYPNEIFKTSYIGNHYDKLITPSGLYFVVVPASEPENTCNYGLAVIPIDKLRSYMNEQGNEWLDKYLTFFNHQWF